MLASAELLNYMREGTEPTGIVPTAIVLGILIGGVTFTGSLIAFAKLQEMMTGAPLVYAGQRFVNALLGVALVGAGVMMVMAPSVAMRTQTPMSIPAARASASEITARPLALLTMANMRPLPSKNPRRDRCVMT